MEVHDAPLAALTLQTHSLAQPEADFLPGGLRTSRHPHIAVTKGDIAADGNGEVAEFELDRPFPTIEPGLLFPEIDAAMR